MKVRGGEGEGEAGQGVRATLRPLRTPCWTNMADLLCCRTASPVSSQERTVTAVCMRIPNQQTKLYDFSHARVYLT